MYQKEETTPQFFWDILNQKRESLGELKAKFGKENISPLRISKVTKYQI